ncbi:MAG: BrnT family toxin [Zoogloeaceae bacterium]|nr:BrnT family toxin [Zoogloeaceae bacterium]
MEIEFDPGKNALNIKKHGVSLEAAARLVWEEAYTWTDERFAYEEWRMLALAPLGDRLFCVAYVDRNEVRRVISLRPATNREKMIYVAEYR